MSGEIKVTDLHPTLQEMIGSGGGDGGKLEMEEYDVQATTVGQTQFEIPMIDFDVEKHSLLVFRNSTRVRSANFTVTGRTVTFPSGVEDPSKTIISFVVLKNVVDGSKLEDDFVDEVTKHLADFEYQTPTINGAQIRLRKQSDTSRLFFKLDNTLSGNITVSLDDGATSKPLLDVDGTQVMSVDKGFSEVVEGTTFFTLRSRGISGADLQALVAIVNEAERNESDLKVQLAQTVNNKTGSNLSNSSTWIDIQNAIGNMTNKKWAKGLVTSASYNLSFINIGGTSASLPYLEITGLDFRPSTVLLTPTNTTNHTSVSENLPKNNGYTVVFFNSTAYRLTGNAQLNDGGFKLPVNTANTDFEWIAFE